MQTKNIIFFGDLVGVVKWPTDTWKVLLKAQFLALVVFGSTRPGHHDTNCVMCDTMTAPLSKLSFLHLWSHCHTYDSCVWALIGCFTRFLLGIGLAGLMTMQLRCWVLNRFRLWVSPEYCLCSHAQNTSSIITYYSSNKSRCPSHWMWAMMICRG